MRKGRRAPRPKEAAARRAEQREIAEQEGRMSIQPDVIDEKVGMRPLKHSSESSQQPDESRRGGFDGVG